MLEPTIRDLARGPNFAALTIIPPSGHPMTHVMWIDADDDHVLINTEEHRAKAKAMDTDGRVTVAIMDRDNPYHYAEVRGRVVGTVTGDAARAHIDALAMKYTGKPYAGEITSARVIYQIAPERQRIQ